MSLDVIKSFLQLDLLVLELLGGGFFRPVIVERFASDFSRFFETTRHVFF